MGNCVSCLEDPNTLGSGPPVHQVVLGGRREGSSSSGTTENPVKQFSYRDLEVATNGFSQQNVIGRGGFGHVYRGELKNGQAIAVKRLDETSQQGEEQFEVEIHMLSRLHHENIVTLIGYSRDKRRPLLLAYAHMPLGSLDTHLYDLPLDRSPLDWKTRMNIALGIARGMEYLHDKTEQQVICRDFKSSNILLDEGFVPKISDFGLARYGPEGDGTHVSTRIMGTYGYCAPEYGATGRLTAMSDVHSLGAVLLEIVTGQKVIDRTRPPDQRNLVTWAVPIISDPHQYVTLADPLLQGRFPKQALHHALAIAAMCLAKDPTARPQVKHVIDAITYLQEAYDVDAAAGGSTSRRTGDDQSRKDKGKAKVDDTDTHTLGRSQGIRIGSPVSTQGIRIGSPKKQGEGTSGGSGTKIERDDVENQESDDVALVLPGHQASDDKDTIE